MPAKMKLPVKAKITALVCRGRRRPKVSHGTFMLAGHQASCRAMRTPTSMPTAPQVTAAIKNFFVIASS